MARAEVLMMSEGGIESALLRTAAGGAAVPTAANNAVVSDFIRGIPSTAAPKAAASRKDGQ